MYGAASHRNAVTYPPRTAAEPRGRERRGTRDPSPDRPATGLCVGGDKGTVSGGKRKGDKPVYFGGNRDESPTSLLYHARRHRKDTVVAMSSIDIHQKGTHGWMSSFLPG